MSLMSAIRWNQESQVNECKCNRANSICSGCNVESKLISFLTIAVLAQTQGLPLAEASVGAEAGYRLGRNSTDDLVQRRVTREAAASAAANQASSETLSSSLSASFSASAEGASVRDRIDRGLARAMMGPSEMANASSSSRITRYYRLYNRCSSKHLRIAGRHVDTLALPGDIYSELQVQTRNFDSQLTIQGSRSMNYLCFNKKGRLTIKHSDREMRCVFHEIHSAAHFTQFQSAFNPHWMIGFGRKGQRLHGDWRSRPPKQHRCFQFVKTDFPYLSHDLNRPGGAGPDRLQRHGPARAPRHGPVGAHTLPHSEQQSNLHSSKT